MGLNFRKRIKIAPGIYINVGKKGVSTSVGGNGATVNIGARGVKATIGVPGTGLSYTEKIAGSSSSESDAGPQVIEKSNQWSQGEPRPVSNLLALGIFFFPIIFAWFLLEDGYSRKARIIAFTWMVAGATWAILH